MPPPRAPLAWRPGHRIISSRFPPVGIFDAIADPADLEALYELESLTNPRLREALGRIDLVPPGRRIAGPGTTAIMAAFTHLNPEGSRFSDGTYGVYYCAEEYATAIAETVHHRERFLARTREPACILEMRCYLADVTATLHDIRGRYPQWHAPADYGASQRAARRLRAAGSQGIVYDSVRRLGGHCAALFYPDLIAPARQGAHLHYHWNASAITHVEVAGDLLTPERWRQ